MNARKVTISAAVIVVMILGMATSISPTHATSIPINVNSIVVFSPDMQVVSTTGTLYVDNVASTVYGSLYVVTSLSSYAYSVPSIPLSSNSARFLLNIPASPNALSSNIQITLSGGTASYSLSVTRDIDLLQLGTVSIVDFSYVEARYGCSLGQSCYDPRADINGDGAINIVDISIEGLWYGSTALSPGIVLSANPNAASIARGDTVASTITVIHPSVTTLVSLTETGCPQNATCTLTPSSGNPTFSSVLTVATTSSIAPGSYPITVTGTDGTNTASTTFTVTVTSAATLADLWSQNAYFARGSYSTNPSTSLDEAAPMARPDLGPNVVYTYYRTKLGCCGDAISLAESTDGGATYTFPTGGAPIVNVGMDACSWDSKNVIAPSVLHVGPWGPGGMFYMVYEGASLSSPITNCSNPSSHYLTYGDIGLATSPDGVSWNKIPGTNPGLLLTHNTSVQSFECQNIGAPFLGWFNNQFYIFFHGDCGGASDPTGLAACIVTGGILCGTGITACNPLGNPSCPFGFRFDSLRNKIGMVHGTDIMGLQTQVTNAQPIMDVGVGDRSWDSRVNGRPSVVQEGGYYYMAFEGAQYVYCTTYNNVLPGVKEGNWGWGLARTANIDTGTWGKYAYNPIRQDFQHQNGCQYNTPYIFKLNGVTSVYDFHTGDTNVLQTGSDPYLHVYKALTVGSVAGQCQTYHNIGRADQDGWSASTGQDSSGYLCYGPYETGLPTAQFAVTFQLMIDVNTGGNNKVLTLDVNDETTSHGVVQTTSDVGRNNFAVAYTYENFELQFASTAGHKYEWRTWWYDGSYNRQYMVFVRQLG
jgi:hypothetical protein